jgi:hypothetical protein
MEYNKPELVALAGAVKSIQGSSIHKTANLRDGVSMTEYDSTTAAYEADE